jgi:hypothetical protein
MTNMNVGNDSSCKVTWSVAVLASREQPTELLATIDTILESAEKQTVIDIMVNGNPDLATKISKLIAQQVDINEHSSVIRVWSLLLGDKANTWNQYLHRVWSGSGIAFFVDGYCRLSPNALRLLEEGMLSAPNSLAGTSVPTTGRSATRWREAVLNEGGLVGGFFAFKESVMKELRAKNFNLPLGLYGYDATLGAVIAFGLDPAKNQWKSKERIFAHPAVTWITNDKKWWRPSDVKSHISRTLKSGLRVLVGQAVRDFFELRKLPPEQLPRTTEEFVLNWVKNNPIEARKTQWRSPLGYLALRKLRKARDWSAAEIPPTLVYSSKPLDVQASTAVVTA